MSKHNLENFWQWRAIKVIWLFAMAIIWILGIVCIGKIFTQKYITTSEVYNHRGQVIGFQNHKAYKHQIAPEWRYIYMILSMLIHTGLLVLTTIVAYRISLYIVYGSFDGIEEKNSKKEKIATKVEEIVEKTEENAIIVVNKDTK